MQSSKQMSKRIDVHTQVAVDVKQIHTSADKISNRFEKLSKLNYKGKCQQTVLLLA